MHFMNWFRCTVKGIKSLISWILINHLIAILIDLTPIPALLLDFANICVKVGATDHAFELLKSFWIKKSLGAEEFKLLLGKIREMGRETMWHQFLGDYLLDYPQCKKLDQALEFDSINIVYYTLCRISLLENQKIFIPELDSSLTLISRCVINRMIEPCAHDRNEHCKCDQVLNLLFSDFSKIAKIDTEVMINLLILGIIAHKRQPKVRVSLKKFLEKLSNFVESANFLTCLSDFNWTGEHIRIVAEAAISNELNNLALNFFIFAANLFREAPDSSNSHGTIMAEIENRIKFLQKVFKPQKYW